MKSRKALAFVSALTGLAATLLWINRSPLESRLPLEILPSLPASRTSNSDLILPFGHTRGPWPSSFRNEPIVTRLTYIKGPPAKFIDRMVQVWRPVEVELTISGPKTLVQALKLEDWRSCFRSGFACISEKHLFWEQVFPDRKAFEKNELHASWYESQSPSGPRGVHLIITTPTYRIDRFAVITPGGTTQVFSLKSILNPLGLESRELFLKTMGSLEVSDDLSGFQKSIETKLQSVKIEALAKIKDSKERLEKLIRVQNWIYSYLSVNPGSLDSYFHLAGITHRLAMDLLSSKGRYFENQEAWIVAFQPLLGTLIQYAKDFPNSDLAIRNMEALLQDFLLKQSQIGKK